ncbi:MAG TPA: ATP-dependent helicase, partial [Saprospiraceae bacterium]|nr:ATP-dependent helicase [Saprospiraceae bacterium]
MKNSSEKKKKKAKSVKKKTSKTRRVSYHRQPEEMELNAWQIALRRQFAQQEEYVIENVGEQPVWSEFRVANPKVATAYRVALRAKEPGANFCSCPDFRTNTLG